MKWKLKKAEYNNVNGISSVEISTHLGIFKGYSSLHPDDKDIVSEFEGCRYAEGRAIIKYFKKELFIINIKLETLNNVLFDYKNMKYYKENKKEIKCLKAKIKDLEEKKKNLENDIELTKKHINFSIEHYREEKERFLKMIADKKEKN